MNGQVSLFDGPLSVLGARNTDPETSHAAASVDRATDRERALTILRAHPDGLTDFALGDLMGRVATSAGKRRGELMAAGLVEWSGTHRPSPSGASARVWVAT